MLITERRLRRLIRRTLLEDNHRDGPTVSEVKTVLESLIPEAKERFKRDNRRFIRSISRGIGRLNLFKRRAVVRALKNFDVNINIVDSIVEQNRNRSVIGYYSLSRDQRFYYMVREIVEKFQLDPGEAREDVEDTIRNIEESIDGISENDIPYGEIVLSAEAIAEKYGRYWDVDDPQKTEFRYAVLSGTGGLYEEITHFVDFFATSVINDVIGTDPFTIEKTDVGWIVRADLQRMGSASESLVTIQDLADADILEPTFNPGGDNTDLILRKTNVGEEMARSYNRDLINQNTSSTHSV
jgi:hypothetical protein